MQTCMCTDEDILIAIAHSSLRENPMMSDVNCSLTMYVTCNLFFGFCIRQSNETVYVLAEYCILNLTW